MIAWELIARPANPADLQTIVNAFADLTLHLGSGKVSFRPIMARKRRRRNGKRGPGRPPKAKK